MPPSKRPRKKHRPNNRYRFTTEECQRGYQAAYEKCAQDLHLLAWLCFRVRGSYRRKKKT
jgi:hypothetical protein